MSQETPEVENHEYDGIREFDNPLPMWWLWTFFITIIFSGIYYIHYEIGGGPTQAQELAEDMKNIQIAQQQAAPKEVETEDSLKALFENPDVVQAGATQYAEKCASCHGPQLQGLIGPNLVDKYWIHGRGSRMDIVEVIKTGVPDKGMPPWGAVMKKEDLLAAAAFIYSKIGSNPPNSKAPQGDAVE